MSISDKFNAYAQEVAKLLKSAGIRTHTDSRKETLQAKIRDATVAKIPYLIIVGAKEVAAKTISTRTRDGKENQGQKVESLIEEITAAIDAKI